MVTVVPNYIYRHTHTHTHTFGRNPLDERSARRRDLYLTTQQSQGTNTIPRRDSNPQSHRTSGCRPKLYIPRPPESETLVSKPLKIHSSFIFHYLPHTCSHHALIVAMFILLKCNDIYIYICRTAALTSRRYILNIYSTNIHTECFKHAV